MRTDQFESLPVMHISPTTSSAYAKVYAALERRDIEKDNIWVIVISLSSLIIIFAAILYHWRAMAKERSQDDVA